MCVCVCAYFIVISSLLSPLFSTVTGGCSNNNGGCSRFCFTLPDSEDPDSISTNHRCSCPTGFRLNSNNRTCNTGNYNIIIHVHVSVIHVHSCSSCLEWILNSMFNFYACFLLFASFFIALNSYNIVFIRNYMYTCSGHN